MRLFFLCSAVALICGCETIKPYEKEYLLNPVMDDAAVSGLTPSMQAVKCQDLEKVSAVGSTGSSSSCPTCGG